MFLATKRRAPPEPRARAARNNGAPKRFVYRTNDYCSQVRPVISRQCRTPLLIERVTRERKKADEFPVRVPVGLGPGLDLLGSRLLVFLTLFRFARNARVCGGRAPGRRRGGAL